MADASLNEIAKLLSILEKNYTSVAKSFYTIFYDPVAQEEVEIKIYDDQDIEVKNPDGTNLTIPNRAYDMRLLQNGSGSPEGVVTGKGKGTIYIDTDNGALYIKTTDDTVSTGWALSMDQSKLNDVIRRGSSSPEGVISASKGAIYIEAGTTASNVVKMYFKTTDSGNTGWIEFIKADWANLSLSNLNSTGEAHFANPSLGNLNATGEARFTSITNMIGTLSNLTTTDKTNTVAAINEVNNKSGMPIGTIYPAICTSSYVPDGALPCDGTEYLKTQFSDLWTNYLNIVGTATEPLLQTCTYSEYESEMNTYGSCAKFAVDTTNNKFKVPTIKDGAYITQAESDSELGKSYNESLPNITYTATKWFGGKADESPTTTGALSFSQSSTFTVSSGSNISFGTESFNASNSSSTYQDNAKVQGDNVRLRYFVQVANGQLNQSQMDWTAWASSLDGKANISDVLKIDVSNATTTTKTSIIEWMQPDYDAKVEKTWGATWSAPTDGWVFALGQAQGRYGPPSVTINDNLFYISQSGLSDAGSSSGCMFPVKANDSVLAASGTGSFVQLYFIPCKGVSQ